MKSFSVTPYWDSRVMNPRTKESRILLTVNLNKQQFRMSIKLFSTKEAYEKALSGRGGDDVVKELRMNLISYVSKAETILQRLPNPTKDTFLKLYKSENDMVVGEKVDVYAYVEHYCLQLIAEQRFTSADNIRNSMSSFKKYSDKLYFNMIDEKFLKGYRTFMLNNNKAITTASIHLRALRGIFKEAVKEGIVIMKPDEDPFKSVNLGWTTSSKNVLTKSDMLKLLKFKPQTVREQRAKDFFFFCYLGNGMNFWDMANLRWKNVKGDFITFIRSKTSGTSLNPKEVRIALCPELVAVMQKYGSKSRKGDDFMFEIFNQHKNNPKQHHKTFKTYKGRTNKTLRDIAKKLGIQGRIYLGVARHTFATQLYHSGTNTNIISEMLGHANESTTNRYMKTLPIEDVKQIQQKLLKFK